MTISAPHNHRFTRRGVSSRRNFAVQNAQTQRWDVPRVKLNGTVTTHRRGGLNLVTRPVASNGIVF